MEPKQKRRKLGNSGRIAGAAKRSKSLLSAPPSKRKRPISADKLPWQTVEVPEMFDDAEGFFGLEEISGVDVVRQGDNVQFVSHP